MSKRTTKADLRELLREGILIYNEHVCTPTYRAECKTCLLDPHCWRKRVEKALKGD